MWINVDWPGLLSTCGAAIVIYVGWMLLLVDVRFSTIEWMLAAFVVAICHILGMLLVLGIFQWLTVSALAWFAIVSTAAVYLFARPRIARIAWQERRRRWEFALRDTLTSTNGRILLPLFIVTGTWVLLLACIFPTYAYDEFMYHMPIVASIIQSRSVVPLDSSVVWIASYPRYSELLSVWTSIFTGRDTFADVAMIPFWIVGGIAIFCIARKVGATRSWSLLCASIWWFCPATIVQAKSTYNDIMVAAVWSIAVALLMPTAHTSDKRVGWIAPSLAAIGFSGLATGLLPGIKISGLVFAASLAGVLLLACLTSRIKKRELIRRGVVFCLAAALSVEGPGLSSIGTRMPILPIRSRFVCSASKSGPARMLPCGVQRRGRSAMKDGIYRPLFDISALFMMLGIVIRFNLDYPVSGRYTPLSQFLHY